MRDKKDLHNYQRHCVEFIKTNPASGLLLDMGLGKTVSTLTAINSLIYEEIEIDTVLVIAPKRVAESVWAQEIANWKHLSHLTISKVIGNERQRKTALAEKADIHIIGRDNVAWLCGQYGGGMLPFDMLVIDESSSFKSPKSIRFKALRKVRPSFKRVVLLTGTPAPNGLLDIWSQIYLLDRGERLGKTLTAYRESFFVPGKRNGAIIFDYNLKNEGEAEIHAKIADICISMKAKDYLELPERINNYVKIDMPKELKKKYEDFEREQVLEIFSTDTEITALNAASLSVKLLQFANGAIYDEDRNWHEVHKLKLEALDEIVENANGKPVLIAYTFKHDAERMLAKFKNARKLDGDADVVAWNKGEVPIMILHPASAGHGLNLQAGGSIIVWFGQTWSLELYQQLNARLDRQGQTETVVINHLMVGGTLDEDVIKALHEKDLKQEGLLAAVKARIKKYKKQWA